MGEFRIVGFSNGFKFGKELPVGGKVTFVMPDNSVVEIDILDILDVDWYEEDIA